MVLQLAKKYRDYMIDTRRYLHMHPELSFEELNTSAMVQRELDKLGIPFEIVEGTYSIIATIKGNKEGKTIALRADMDALSIKELNDFDFKSTIDGAMHACGHDGHTAALLGAAHILVELKDQIHGTIKLVFESGEEYGGTVKAIEKAGYLDQFDHCFALHIWADIPVGKFSCEAGARMAGTDLFEVIINGKGAHASAPEQGIDALVAAASVILNLQTIVSRELSPNDVGVVTIGKMSAGQRFNSIPDKAVLEGNLRSFDMDVSKNYKEQIKRIVKNTASAFRAEGVVTFNPISSPPLINSKENSNFAKNVVRKLYDEDRTYPFAPLMAGEDFATFIEKVGGTHLLLGGGYENKENAPQHHGNFDFDENCLEMAAAIEVQYALDYLQAHSK